MKRQLAVTPIHWTRLFLANSGSSLLERYLITRQIQHVAVSMNWSRCFRRIVVVLFGDDIIVVLFGDDIIVVLFGDDIIAVLFGDDISLPGRSDTCKGYSLSHSPTLIFVRLIVVYFFRFSAMLHIRNAGQRLSFLVAKSDIHVAMQITASSCWRGSTWYVHNSRATHVPRTFTIFIVYLYAMVELLTDSTVLSWEVRPAYPPLVLEYLVRLIFGHFCRPCNALIRTSHVYL